MTGRAAFPAVVRPSVRDEPLGIVAGGGDLPRIVADEAARHGWSPRIVAIGDGLDADWSPYPNWPMGWGHAGDVFRLLRGEGIKRLVLCGTVSARPDFRRIVPSLRTLAMLPMILRITRGGDDTLLRAAAKVFEARGFDLLAVQEIVPELLMPAECLTRRSPSEAEAAALTRALGAARVIGVLDVGQAVVASRDRVIALEGIEGTREMLARVADLRRRGRIGEGERCVLVKSVKPGQDLRFDLPAIGMSTIEEAAAAGLAGIGLSAGHALIIRLDDVIAAAEKRGLFVTGLLARGDHGEGAEA